MRLEAKDLKPCKGRMHGFNGSVNEPIGMVELLVKLGEGD